MRGMLACSALAAWLLTASTQVLAQPAEAQSAQLIAQFDANRARGLAVVQELAAMAAEDNYLRDLLIQGFNQPMSAATRQTFIEGVSPALSRAAAAHTERLRQILRETSWDELARLSPRAVRDALALVSHSEDNAFKREVAGQIEPLALAGRMPGEQYAILVDDLAETEGHMQRYGTNFNCRDGRYQANPIEDAAHVNERRASLQMEPIEAFSERMQSMYGACPAG